MRVVGSRAVAVSLPTTRSDELACARGACSRAEGRAAPAERAGSDGDGAAVTVEIFEFDAAAAAAAAAEAVALIRLVSVWAAVRAAAAAYPRVVVTRLCMFAGGASSSSSLPTEKGVPVAVKKK